MPRVKPELLLIGAGQWILDWCEYYQIPYALIQKPSLYEPHTATETVLLEYESDPKLWDYVDALCSKRDIIACLTSSESALEIAEQITRRFNIAYQSCRDQTLLRDKYSMRSVLAASGLNNVAYTLVHDDVQMQKFLAEQGDIVLKPRDGVASQSISRVTSQDSSSQPVSTNYPLLAERYIEGQEYSVEAFSYAGEHKIIGVTEKTVDPLSFVEKRHVFPAALEPQEGELIHATVQQFLDTTGVKNGPSHTELKIENGKAFIIEGHNRAAGDAISSLVEMVTGVNVYQQLVAWACLQERIIDDNIIYNRVAMIDFIFADAGVVTRISGIQSSLALAGVIEVKLYYSVGDRIEPTTSSYSRFGHIIIHATDHDECERVLEKVQSRLKISVQ